MGLVYIDLDTDLNPPDASDGALDWTGVAHLLDLKGTISELSGMGPRRPLLRPSEILFFAADNMAPGEAETIETLGMACCRLAEVKADPRTAATRAVNWGARFRACWSISTSTSCLISTSRSPKTFVAVPA